MAQPARVTSARLRERCGRLLEIGPPFQRRAVAAHEHDVQLGLDVDGSAPRQLQVAVPGHAVEGPMEEGVGIVQEARVPFVLDGGEPAAGHVAPLEAQDLQPRPAEVVLEHEAVVSRAEDDPVVLGRYGPASASVTVSAFGAAGYVAHAWPPSRSISTRR